MSTKRALAYILLMVVGLLIYVAAIYGSLPDSIPIHWNIRGEADGYAPKQWAFLLGPGMPVLSLLLLFGLPAISPGQFGIQSFRSTFNTLMVVIAGMMAFVGVASLQGALHNHVDMGKVIMGGMFFFFALIGNLLVKVRRNFWVGFRTPWTLASESVWVATHRMGGRLMVVGGLVGMLGALIGAPFVALFVWLMAIALWPCVFSYIAYQRIEGDGT